MTSTHPPDDDSSTGSDLLTRVFSVLANTRRRRALRYLRRHESVSLPTLADGVAEREAGRPLHELDAETVKKVYLSLYHAHIPELEAADVVRYDQEEDWVTTREGRPCRLAFSLLDSVPSPPGGGPAHG